MKIYYWSPFISKVATVSSVIKSAESILKYSKKNSNINVAIVDAVGEWNNYKKLIDPKIEIINLNKKNILNYLPKGGFLKSRISYTLIFILTFFKLLNLLNKKKTRLFNYSFAYFTSDFFNIYFSFKTCFISSFLLTRANYTEKRAHLYPENHVF